MIDFRFERELCWGIFLFRVWVWRIKPERFLQLNVKITLTFWSNLESKGKNGTEALGQNGKVVCVGMKIPQQKVEKKGHHLLIKKINAYP